MQDSLHSWVQQHSAPGGLSHVPQVPYADRWMRQAAALDPAAPATATATASTANESNPGHGSTAPPLPPNPSSSQSEALVVDGVPEPIVPEHWDWTFSSEYCCR